MTDSLDTDAVSVVRDGLEIPCVGVSVVKLFGLFVVWIDCSKVDAVLCKLGLVSVVPLLTSVEADEVKEASVSKKKKKRITIDFLTNTCTFLKTNFFL